MLAKKAKRRKRIKQGVRGKIFGTAERPRLAVFRSNKEIYAQLIDDNNGHTLAAASSRDAQVSGLKENKVAKSKIVGLELAKIATAAGISVVLFDRGGFLYHGRVKSLADGAREGGLKF